MRRCVLIATLLTTVACERGREPPEEVPRESSPRGEAPDSGVAAFFERAPVELPSNRAEIQARLGRADSVAAETVTNRHDPTVTDSILRLYYPGLVVEIYRAGYDGKEMLAGLQIADDRYLRPDSPLRLGATAAQVRAVLGEPEQASAERLEYTCEECLVAGQERVTLLMERGSLSRIHFRYWID